MTDTPVNLKSLSPANNAETWLSLGVLHEAVKSFSEQSCLETFWSCVCKNARWIIPAKRTCIVLWEPDAQCQVVERMERGRLLGAIGQQDEAEVNLLKLVRHSQGIQWFNSPWGAEDHSHSMCQWLLQDDPTAVLTVPIQKNNENIGAILFALHNLGEADRTMLSSLATGYALYVSMTYAFLETNDTLKRTNQQLEIEIEERQDIETELQQYKLHLEDQVEERTQALTETNKKLSSEVEERAQTQSALWLQEARLRALYDITTRSEFSIAEQFEATLEIGTSMLGLEFGLISHIENGTYTVLHTYAPEVSIEPNDVFPIGHTYCEETIQTKSVVAINHAAASPYAKHPCYQNFQFESYIGVAIEVDGEPFGTLSFSSLYPKKTAFNQSDKDFIQLIAQWVGSTIERERAAEMLQLTKYSIDTSSEAILWVDQNGKILSGNQGASNSLGYSIQDLETMFVFDIDVFLTPEYWPDHWAELKEVKTIRTTSQHQTKNGQVFPVEVDLTYIEFNGKGYNFAHIRDITEREQAEANIKNANIHLQQRVNELAALNRVTETVTSGFNLNQVLKTINEELTKLLTADTCGIALLNPEKTVLTVVAEYSVLPNIQSSIGITMPLDENPFSAEIIDTQQAMVVEIPPIVADTEEYQNILSNRHVFSMIIVPLIIRGEVIGTIGLANNTNSARTFSDQELRLVETFAGQAAGTVDTARLLREEQRQRQIAESLREISIVLNSSFNQEEILSLIFEQLGQVLDYDEAGIFLQDGSNLKLVADTTSQAIDIGFNVPLSGQDPAVRVFNRNQLLIIPDVHLDSGWEIWEEGEWVRAWVGAPLVVKGQPIGVLTADSRAINAFQAEDGDILEAFAHQVATAIQNAQLFQQEQRQRQIAESLRQVSTALSQELDRDKILNIVFDQLQQVIDYDSSALFLLNGQEIELVAGRNLHDTFIGRRLSYDDPNPTAEILRKKTSIFVSDVHQNPGWVTWPGGEPIRAWMGAPIVTQEQLIGVLTLDNYIVNAYDDEDVQILQLFANQVAIAIQNAQLFQQEQRQRQIAESLRQVSTALSRELDRDKILNIVFDQLQQVIDYDSSALFLLDGEELELSAGRNLHGDFIGIRLPIDDINPTVEVIRNKEPIFVSDVREDPRWDLWSDEELIRAWMGTPIVTQEQLIGVLTLDSYSVDAYDDEDVRLLQLFANQVGIAIQNAELYAEAQHEITERKHAEIALRESEARFRHIVENAGDAFFIHDLEGNLIEVNEAACRQLGYSRSELLAVNLQDIVYQDPEANPNQPPATGVPVTLEANHTHKDGTIFPVEVRLVKAEFGGRDLILALARDITARKRYEEAITEARDKALESNRLKSELLAKVSHELRTPLGAILGYAELIQDGIFGEIQEPQAEALSEIIDSTNYLTVLVKELLDQAQLETGKVQIETELFLVQDLVKQADAQMRVLAQPKNLDLIFNIADDVPQTLVGDQNRLHQILINLVGNAIKFTDEGRIEVKIYCPDVDHWSIAVSDTGQGIPPEAQTYIFEPFRQVDGTITRETVGTGLGLSIVKQFTSLMGGEISLESTINQGSTFIITLPIIPTIQETSS